MAPIIPPNKQKEGQAAQARREIGIHLADPNSTNMATLTAAIQKKQGSGGLRMAPERSALEMNLLGTLNGPRNSVERLSFESDPTQRNSYAAIYQGKLKLIPDSILKRIAIQDDLVASIVQTRANQVQAFGRPQPDRFSMGFKLVVDKQKEDKLDKDEKAALQDRINKLEKRLVTCGDTEGWDLNDQLTFPTFLNLITRNAVTVGRLAVEAIPCMDEKTGKQRFHSFRPVDAGTIYRATPFKTQQDTIRAQARRLLAEIKNERLQQAKFEADEYAWIQVNNGKPLQAFTEKELYVHTVYPVIDIELDGYPVTPIDTAINAITTHINITTHNRLYFQSGRATKGMLVVKSADVNEQTLSRFKHQFQASINNVANSWRMPVFAINPTDEITWQPIDQGGKDMEFQYLSDTNARVIMSAYQISPEELPGYQHLSRGTNNQALSEGNNEYKLEAARDVGIRPLLSQIEDFMNQRIMPLMDETLSKIVVLKFVGLDAETREKETTRLQGEQAVTGTYDSLMTATDQDPIGPEFGGTLPLNAIYSQKLDAYFTVGAILERFGGEKYKGFSDPQQHPELDYRRDPFWFNQQQMLDQRKQMEMQAQQQQMAAAQGQPPPDGGGGAPPAGGAPPQDPNAAPPADPNAQPQGGGDLSTGIDQLLGMLSKSENQLPASRRRLLAQQRQSVTRLIEDMETDIEKLSERLLSVADRALPDRNKE